jgi:hypothetical protein
MKKREHLVYAKTLALSSKFGYFAVGLKVSGTSATTEEFFANLQA